MNSKNILIHTHFHSRRTGVTRSIENVFPYFENECEPFILGYRVKGRKISLLSFLRLIFSKNQLVIHCHRNNEILFILLLRFLGAKFKLVSTRHAETPPAPLTNFLLKKSDKVVVLTERMQNLLSFPTEMVGHGVDENLFIPNIDVSRPEISQPYFLTCAGRVREAKGQKFLLETMAPILKQYSNWAMVIVGRVDSAAFFQKLKKVIADHAIEDQVYFISETPQIISFYQASRAVIVPSFTEGFSLVCAEAMSCGCNVLASRGVGIHSEIIKEGETGYLFDVKNASELKKLLQDLFQGKLLHLGDDARKAIIKNWSSKVEAEKLMKLYNLNNLHRE